MGGNVDLNRDGPEALYVQIAEDIARSLGTNVRPGERLPSEAEFVAKYGVSRITVRQALSYLGERGLVVRKQGKGTFAAMPRVHHDLQSLSGFHATLATGGLNPETELLDYAVVEAEDHVKRHLRIDTDRVLRYRRLYRVATQPVAVVDVHMPPVIADIATPEVVGANPSYTLLRNVIGLAIGRADLTFRVEPVDETIAELLGLALNSPILMLERITYCRADIAREYSQFSLPTHTHEFGFTVPDGVEVAPGIRTISAAK